MLDYLIIGSGIAGLYASLSIPKDKKSLMLSKKKLWECNTYYAQGGVATAKDESDISVHISDTLEAGARLCDIDAVTKLSKDSIFIIQDLINKGFEFDKVDNSLAFTKEAAHSTQRILHADGDATGRVLHRFLVGKTNTPIRENTTVVDLLIRDNICYGATVYSDGVFENIYAKNTIIASGGIGSLYKYHTNSNTSSGELQGIAIEKGIELGDMEMTQFHPTVYIDNKESRKMLLTEALRGEGAYIVDEDNRRFLFDYDDRAELAPRSIVSRALYDYTKKTGKKTYISFENFSRRFFSKRFPNISLSLEKMGYFVPDDKIPISPAFHYFMGGIKTDLNAKVPNFKNLYAIGEVANTGVHGANRLASNSLLEALVFGKSAIDYSLKHQIQIDEEVEFGIKKYKISSKIDKKIKNSLRTIMWESAGIVRNNERLKESLDKIDKFLDEDCGRMLKLRLLSARAIITSAIAREDSIGVHFKIEGE